MPKAGNEHTSVESPRIGPLDAVQHADGTPAGLFHEFHIGAVRLAVSRKTQTGRKVGAGRTGGGSQGSGRGLTDGPKRVGGSLGTREGAQSSRDSHVNFK